MKSVLETVQIQVHAKPNVQNKSKISNIARLNREYFKAY